jgi:uncharacterized protein (DUF2147 family)
MKKNNPYIFYFLILFVCFSFSSQAQSVLGRWQTVNAAGLSSSIIEIYKVDNVLNGKVVKLLNKEDRDRVCTKCEGEMKNLPIQGLVVMTGLEKSGDEYQGGTVTDPKSGKVYRCKIWLDEDNPEILKVRGYISIFYSTQTWIRED